MKFIERMAINMNENQKSIKKCFDNLIKNNIISENDLRPSTITDKEINDLQSKFNIELPEFYKDFLKTYFLNLIHC